MKQWISLILSAVLLAGCSAQVPEPKEEEPVEIIEMKGSEPGGQKYEATIKVKDYGDIVFEMDEGIAPETVQNFVKLANEGFYDGLTFHRLIEGFMAQGGDPNGDGTGGAEEDIQGEFLSNGFNNSLKHVRGTVSMARSGDPDSASSQFFIVQEDTPSLDGEYAAFGTVTSGMDVVDKILEDARPTDDNGTISKDSQPVIESITVTKDE
ncbi:peptidylprolyl isomerase [Faecalibaculum rodentium]|uniref:peptidylprolyl isomerase n=1 Tax=Faecalibaculum rodentium TaxID=1702221 RepID=UPI003C6D5991